MEFSFALLLLIHSLGQNGNEVPKLHVYAGDITQEGLQNKQHRSAACIPA